MTRVAAVATGAETSATVKKTTTTTTAETEIASVAAETRQMLARTQTAEAVAKETGCRNQYPRRRRPRSRWPKPDDFG